MGDVKTGQLQIRVSPEQKRALKRRAKDAGLDVSAWVLRRLLPTKRARFVELVRELSDTDRPSYPLAAFADFVVDLSAADMGEVLGTPPDVSIPALSLAYVAALIEERAVALGAAVPAWVREVPAVPEPYFASRLVKLRLHLLTRSPAPFRRRNLFVDRGPGRV